MKKKLNKDEICRTELVKLFNIFKSVPGIDFTTMSKEEIFLLFGKATATAYAAAVVKKMPRRLLNTSNITFARMVLG